MTTTTRRAPLDQPAAPDAAADLAVLLQLLAVLIAKGESVRDVLDFCRRRVEAASGTKQPPSNAAVKLPALLTTQEVAEYLRVHRNTMYKLWHSRKLKMVKVGGSTRWRRSELERYIDRQTKGAR